MDAKTVTYYARVLLSLAGFALAIAGALSAWITTTFSGMTASSGFFAATVTAGGSTSSASYSPAGQPAAAGALLLIGFIVGFFHFVNTIHPRGAEAFFHNSPLILASLAFVSTFIGTVVGGGVRYQSDRPLCVRAIVLPVLC
jgi:hypothetical protein